MSTTPEVSGTSMPSVPLRDIERELTRQLKLLQGSDVAPVQLVRMSNLVIFCQGADTAERIAAWVPDVVALHPARVLLLVGEEGPDSQEITAALRVQVRRLSPHQQACSEQVTLRAAGPTVNRLPFAVRSLIVGDLPINLWWASPLPPPLAGPLLYDLAEAAQQIVYDSLGWTDPVRGVAATASWLAQIERDTAAGRWRVASDLNWRRLKYWRRLLTQALDPASAPGAIDSITEVLIEHGPHAVVQAWEVAGWLAARLGWEVQAGRVDPNVEIAWRFVAAAGAVRVRVRRLPEGEPEVRRIRIACTLDGKPGALELVVEDEQRLAIRVEGTETAPRTVTTPSQTPAELVGRQLSDRECDPIFVESMAVAQVLAQSLLE